MKSHIKHKSNKIIRNPVLSQVMPPEVLEDNIKEIQVYKQMGNYTIYKKIYNDYLPDYFVTKNVVLKSEPYKHERCYSLKEAFKIIRDDKESQIKNNKRALAV